MKIQRKIMKEWRYLFLLFLLLCITNHISAGAAPGSPGKEAESMQEMESGQETKPSQETELLQGTKPSQETESLQEVTVPLQTELSQETVQSGGVLNQTDTIKRLKGGKLIQKADQLRTVATYINGDEETLEGLPALEALEREDIIGQVSSYEVFYDEKSIMEVTLHGINQKAAQSQTNPAALNGYYAVRFPLTDSKKVFITGLTARNVEKTQKTLMKKYTAGEMLSIKDIDYIDTEKTAAAYEDDNLCWAASCSNQLHYTGWGEQAGFYDPDDLFDLFVNSFLDGGSNAIYGYNWFFNGNRGIDESYLTDDWATIKEYGSSGNYLPDYDANMLMEYIAIENEWTQIETVLERMEAGYGIELGVNWLGGGGHSVSCWGYVVNENYTADQQRHYEALLVSDSDSNEMEEEDRRTAPNTLELITLEPYVNDYSGAETWICQGWWNNDGVVDEFVTLVPFGEEVPKETDSRATRDKLHNIDTYGCGLLGIAGAPDIAEDRIFYEGDRLYFSPVIENTADVDYEGEYSYVLTVTDVKGNLICEKEIAEQIYMEPGSWYYFDHFAEVEGLTKGTYTVAFSLNPKLQVPEAYLYNNTYRETIKIIKDSIDLSKVSFGIKLDEGMQGLMFTPENEGMFPAELYYKGISQAIMEQFSDSAVSMSYLIDKEKETWSGWEYISSFGGTAGKKTAENSLVSAKKSLVSGKQLRSLAVGKADETTTGKAAGKNTDTLEKDHLGLPEECLIAPIGSQVRLRLVLAGKKGQPNRCLISDSYDLYYQKAEVNVGEHNTEICTRLEHGASGLAFGEQFSFDICNVSTYDGGPVEGYCYLAAYGGWRSNEKLQLTEELPFSAAYGEKVNFSVSSWDPQYELSGTYLICAHIVTDLYESEIVLSELAVEEQRELHVTISQDKIDPYDGETSFREAIDWYRKGHGTGEEITFEEELAETCIILKEPVVIDGEVVINGIRYQEEEGPFGITLEMENGASGFHLCEGSSLTMKGIAVIFAESGETKGAAIINEGGLVVMDHCRIFGCTGEYGVLYTLGGKMRISNSSFKYNMGLNGSILCMEGGADVSLLNCTVFWNEAEESLIANKGGSLNIVNCTLADNAVNQSAVFSGEGACTRMLNSVCLMNGESELTGGMKIYASQIGELNSGYLKEKDIPENFPESERNRCVIVDAYTKVGTDPQKFFTMFEDEKLVTEYYASTEEGTDCIHYPIYINAKAPAGVQIFHKNGKLLYVTKKLKTVMTDMTADFEEVQYHWDELEHFRGFSCGSQSYDPENILYTYTNCQGETLYTLDAEKDGIEEKHRFGQWTTVLEAGEHTAGMEERNCEVCGFTETKKIPPVGGEEEIPETSESTQDDWGDYEWMRDAIWFQKQIMDLIFRWFWG